MKKKAPSDSIDEAAYGTVYNTPIMTYRGGSLWQPRTSPIGWRADTKGHIGILFYLYVHLFNCSAQHYVV